MKSTPDLSTPDLISPGWEPWRDQARCTDSDPELWYPDKGQPAADAKRICRGCEVRTECLSYALARDERWGIWGGTTEADRRKLRRGKGDRGHLRQVPKSATAWRISAANGTTGTAAA